MRADLLHVVTAIANPLRWESRIRLFRQFEQHMLESGVHLTVVECAYGERPFQCEGTAGVNHVGVRAKTPVWSKECLLNIGIARLPAGARYIGTFDADIRFRRPDWAAETVHALQLHHVVQPWSDCYDLGPNDEHMEHHVSFARQFVRGEVVITGPRHDTKTPHPHPGYAWAWTREALDVVGGLFELGGMGSGDRHMAHALVGKTQVSTPKECSDSYRRRVQLWEENAWHLGGSIGCAPGTIEHSFHGSKAHRQYLSRWDLFLRHGFDPDTDLKRNSWGVLEFSGNKPELQREWLLSLAARREDANSA